jgi:hypothetical protein
MHRAFVNIFKWIMIVEDMFNHKFTETYYIFFWVSNIYIRFTLSNITPSVVVSIYNHVIELLSILIITQIIAIANMFRLYILGGKKYTFNIDIVGLGVQEKKTGGCYRSKFATVRIFCLFYVDLIAQFILHG